MVSKEASAREVSHPTELTLRRRSELSKRLFDLFLGCLLLALITPLSIVIALLVKLTSSGPVLFRQTRYGMDMREFTLFKFRTMRQGTDDEPHREYILQINDNEPPSHIIAPVVHKDKEEIADLLAQLEQPARLRVVAPHERLGEHQATAFRRVERAGVVSHHLVELLGRANGVLARHRVGDLHNDITRLQAENTRLRGEIDSAKHSTFAVEKIAREDLGLSKKGEVVYMLPQKQ